MFICYSVRHLELLSIEFVLKNLLSQSLHIGWSISLLLLSINMLGDISGLPVCFFNSFGSTSLPVLCCIFCSKGFNCTNDSSMLIGM